MGRGSSLNQLLVGESRSIALVYIDPKAKTHAGEFGTIRTEGLDGGGKGKTNGGMGGLVYFEYKS